MPDFKLLLVAAAGLIDVDGRVLMAERLPGKMLGGMWEFPGGKLEAGESPEVALIRELHEELGIVVEEACLAPLTFSSHAYEAFHLLLPFYVCRKWQGEVRSCEGQRLRWVRPQDMGDYEITPAGRPLVPMLRDLLL